MDAMECGNFNCRKGGQLSTIVKHKKTLRILASITLILAVVELGVGGSAFNNATMSTSIFTVPSSSGGDYDNPSSPSFHLSPITQHSYITYVNTL